jgi:S1-C subfamily serine protease/predicted RNA-binding Zn-ribbon protein involved in translation (DUF1610 family)
LNLSIFSDDNLLGNCPRLSFLESEKIRLKQKNYNQERIVAEKRKGPRRIVALRRAAPALVIVLLFVSLGVVQAGGLGHVAFADSSIAAPNQGAIVSNIGLPATVLVDSNLTATVNCNGIPNVQPFQTTESVGAFGSGFFVNSQGYIVTNAHVVFSYNSPTPTDDQTDSQLLIEQLANQISQSYEAQNGGATLSQSQMQELEQELISGCTLNGASVVEYVFLGTSQASGIQPQALPATIVGSPSPFDQRDLAILKVSLMNTPSLMISNSTSQAGDDIFAMGFPGAVVEDPMLNPNQLLQPSFTEGIIGGARQSASGNPLYAISAAISNGNSGGPVMNDQGQVVGVSELGTTNPETGEAVQGLNFAIQGSVVLQYLTENGIPNTQSSIDTIYMQGLAYYYSGEYASAISMFQNVLNVYPYQWNAQQLLSQAQSAVNSGQKAQSQINLSVNTTDLKQGQDVSVSGTISSVGPTLPDILENLSSLNWSGVSISITYSGPNGKEVTHAVTPSSDGAFSDSFIPTSAGTWNVSASWGGNTNIAPSSSTSSGELAVKANSTPGFTTNSVLYIALGIVAAVMAVLALYFVMRRKAKTQAISSTRQILETTTSFVCSNCGSESFPRSKFCGNCGAGLMEEVVSR